MAVRCAFAITLVIVCSIATPSAADPTDDRRALVMLRVLAYDKQLAQRIGDEVRVIVAYPADEAGAAEGMRWATAFAKASKLKVNGRSVSVIAYKVESLEALGRVLERSAAVVACDGLARKIGTATFTRLTRARRVLSISTYEADVAGGLSVAVVPGKQRDEIVVNLRAAQAEGVKFDAGLLQLAREVKEGAR